ncbi:WAT1-related protein At2g37460-like [Salvia hispanica]|uniref:WAT1-related protein At2g37460-like n=1 Tax=Salvia hispanica TaxID=49212 RepID=UPI0020098019|nr:WAT1-related protein At2g37460-like [Salvia hispanica]
MDWKKVKPYVCVIILQLGNAGFSIVAKAALNQGSSHFTFSVYRNAFAAAIFIPLALFLERKTRPRITLSTFIKILLLGSIDPVIGQNAFYAGLKYSSPTFISAMCNLLPAITFLLAWILRIEKVKWKDIRSHAKIVGTLITVGGAMMVTLMRGHVIELPWTHKSTHTNGNEGEDPIKGALMITTSCLCYSSFYILQAITLKAYPAGLSLTAAACTMGTVIGTALTLGVERGNAAIWALGWDTKLLAYVYGGIFSSGLGYYLAGVVINAKGPVFLTAFSPLSLVIVAIMSSFIFAEQMRVGMVSGAVVIVIGLYMVIWGKTKDHKEAEKIQLPHLHNKSSSSFKATSTARSDEPISSPNVV